MSVGKLAAAAALAVAMPFADVAFAENQKTPPGQEKKAGPPPAQAPAEQGNGYGAGKSEKPARADRPAKGARPAKPPRSKAKKAKPAPKPANPRARAGKTTICHATGSETNPYVKITISDNALKAHARHQDGRDIIPAPAEGCPASKRQAGEDKPEKPAAGKGQDKVTICHATGSETNPYVKITIAEPAVDAHRDHQDGEDIIPAPEGDCPATAPAPAGAGAPRDRMDPSVAAPANALLGPRSGVLGEFAAGGGASPGTITAAAAPADVAGQTARNEQGADTGIAASLPFTGLDTWLLVAAGLGLLLAGVAARRATNSRA